MLYEMGYCLKFFKTYLPFVITIQNVKTINDRLFVKAPLNPDYFLQAS
jgi:hypothetical protein